MNPINTPPMRIGVNAATPSITPSAVRADSSPVTISVAHFSHYHVVGDGDCLFRAMHMGLANQPGVEPRQEQVMGLRQYLASYVYQHQDTLANHPAFEGRQGVLNLYDLLLTPGQWNHNAGDLVAPLLAQVSGRPLAVLQPTQEGTAYNVRQVFPAENPTLPAGLAHTGEPTICLAHINGNHYGYLEERYPNVLLNAFNQPRNINQPRQVAEASDSANQELTRGGEEKSGPKKRGRKMRSTARDDEIAQLWLAYPGWGYQKLQNEFNQRNPGANVSPGDVRRIKRTHPSLQSHNLGGTLGNKKDISPEFENALVQLWRSNPSWGYLKIINKFNKCNPGVNLTSGDVRRLKATHPDLQDLNLGGSVIKLKKLDDKQEQALVQLLRENPRWSRQQVLDEMNKNNPGLDVSIGDIRRIKAANPDLKTFKLDGVQKTPKKLTEAQETSMARLWRENPRWSYRKMTSEFNQRNPDLYISTATVRRVKEAHPSLQGLKLDASKYEKNLSNEQERELAQFWLENPSWGEQKVAREFLKRNPGTLPTKSVAHRLRVQHPDLRGIALGSNVKKKNLSEGQEREVLQLWQANPHWGGTRLAQEYKRRNPEVDVSRNIIYRLKASKPNFFRQETLANRASVGLSEDDTRSQETFAALSDIASLDDLSDEYDIPVDTSSDDSSQGTFDGLDDLAEIPRLKD